MEWKEVAWLNLNALTMNIDREHDSCGIFARIEKSGVPSPKTLQSGIQALKALRHRAGYVQGEGDGCGLLLDIPRVLWHDWLRDAGSDGKMATNTQFVVAHLLLRRADTEALQRQVLEICRQAGFEVLCTRAENTVFSALGPVGQRENPMFLQIGGLVAAANDADVLTVSDSLEGVDGVHVMSMSRDTVVYKVIGDGDTLEQYYSDLQDSRFTSTYVLAHTRYSTNTATAFSRVQPFSMLGHNGEINTISRFYTEAAMIGIPLDANFSDSQMVNGAISHLSGARGWSLFEVAELLFPPIIHEVKQLSQALSDMYMFYRSLWGPFAQGPAGMMLRCGQEAVFSVDALGLRPMWLVETADAYCFSSEQGLIPGALWQRDPKPLAPGEKIGFHIAAGDVKLYLYDELQQAVLGRARKRYQFHGEGKSLHFTGPGPAEVLEAHPHHSRKPLTIRAAAFGWREDDYKMLDAEVQTGAEPIKSLGYDGPLPALDDNVHSVSEFLQEAVAVVTNPAIDREREIEHFSTRTVLGRRPSMDGLYHNAPRVEVQSPILLEELPPYAGVSVDELRMMAYRHGTLCFEDVLMSLRNNIYGTVELLLYREPDESIPNALARLKQEALEAVQAGANILVLDDRIQFSRADHLDVFVAVAAIHKSLLRPASSQGGEFLRRRVSIVLRSAAVRNLHDIACAVGLGADAVDPYLLWEIAAYKAGAQGVDNVYTALCKGLEKVISTLGIHEVRGYERLFGAIGLHDEVADIIGVPNFCGGEGTGYGFEQMEADAIRRLEVYQQEDEKRLTRQKVFQLYPRIWKSAGLVAMGESDYDTFVERLTTFERDNPISLRHTLDFQRLDTPELQKSESAGCNHEERVDAIDTTIDGHQFPLVISSMSFGSQGETAYRAYAEAAYRLNIVGLNGEGGEIKDLLTAYPRNRGRQVASGRFGVNADLCNGAYILEIKIGQGAKPGEGGHLPGSKVTVQVANARNATTGVDLISPSNNHDIYSIEDLAQVIYELRQVNPFVRISVKVPVVPNIGTIAVGIAKAGADVVTLSGFDGGTGAARSHALRHVGLPVEIGIKLAHEALSQSGLRNVVEIWADGGVKSGVDVMKLILLGANRVGFGTMAMVALGCTSCRACHKDTCHVGIATQMTSLEEAQEKGLSAFVPREFDTAVANLVRFFSAIGEHVRKLTHTLGATRTQDLVGRSDLLKQVSFSKALNLTGLTSVQSHLKGNGTHIQFRDFVADEMDSVWVSTAGESLQLAVGGNVRPGHSARNNGGSRHELATETSNDDADPILREVPRALGVYESGQTVRRRGDVDSRGSYIYPHCAGNGFAAYHTAGLNSTAYGGAQDGVGKAAFGGRIVVLKQRGPDGIWRGGSVGKGLAYGAGRGLFIIQGNADARAGIRLSGADVVIGGEVEGRVRDELGSVASRSNIKGFAFEYMTNGRAVVLGDAGPWMCSGMTGGAVYLRHAPDIGLTEQVLRRRVAKGAKVSLRYLDAAGEADVIELLTAYQKELRQSGQMAEAKHLQVFLTHPGEHFLVVKPGLDITDQSIATE